MYFPLIFFNRRIITPMFTQVLSVLHFYATGSYQAPISCSWLTCLGRSTLGFFIDEVTMALNDPEVQRRWIRFPRTRAQRQRLQAKYDVWNHPSTVMHHFPWDRGGHKTFFCLGMSGSSQSLALLVLLTALSCQYSLRQRTWTLNAFGLENANMH